MNIQPIARYARGSSIGVVGLIVLALLGIAPTPGSAQAPQAAAPAANATTALYDASLGNTPDKQKFQYQAINGNNPFGTALATQTFSNGATTLDTSGQIADLAGYATTTPNVPVLDRHVGFSLDFTIQLQQETHTGSDKNGDNIDDRAGFSIIVLASDRKGIELDFWTNQIWVQNDGAAEPPAGTLFTHGEGAAFNTSSGLISYTLAIKGNAYSVSSGGSTILTGNVRDYTAWEAPPFAPANPYRTPNVLILSDNSTSASGITRLKYVAITVPNNRQYLPFLRR